MKPSWNELKQIRCWTPLRHLPFELEKCSEGLYRIEERKFLFAVPHSLDYPELEGPFATIILWAQSHGDAKNAMELDVDPCAVTNSQLPPEELLLSPACSTYSGLRNYLKELHRWYPYTETDVYRMIPEGQFAHRRVTFENLVYLFRSFSRKKEEIPFAVEYRLNE